MPAERVRLTDDGDIEYGGVFEEGAFDFEGSDAIPGTFNDIVLPADEPEIGVGVTDGAVAGEVEGAAELLLHLGGIAPVLREEAEGAVGLEANSDFALVSRGHLLEVFVDEADVHVGDGATHGAWKDGLAGGPEMAGENDGFGLAVTFVEEKAGGGLPDFEDLRVERFAGGDAMAEGGEAPFGEVLADDEAQGRGRGAPGVDGEGGQGVEGEDGVELSAMVEGEDAGATVPGAVEAGPSGFAPTQVGDVPVDVAGLEVEPEFAGKAVGQTVADLGVEDHFGFAGGGAGKVEDSGVGGAGADGRGAVGSGFDAVIEIQPAGRGLAHEEPKAVVSLELGDALGAGDGGTDFGGLETVFDVALGEQQGGGDGHGAEANEAEHGDPPLGDPREHQEDAVARADSGGVEKVGGFAAEGGQFAEGEAGLVAGILRDPPEGAGVRGGGFPGIENVVGEIEERRRLLEARRMTGHGAGRDTGGERKCKGSSHWICTGQSGMGSRPVANCRGQGIW